MQPWENLPKERGLASNAPTFSIPHGANAQITAKKTGELAHSNRSIESSLNSIEDQLTPDIPKSAARADWDSMYSNYCL